MKTTPLTPADLRRSVISVPPLCRKADLTLADDENTRLIRHLEAGGVTSFLYGGNANLYNIAVSEYASLLEYLAGAVSADSIVVPSVGPFYGNIIDQAAILKEHKFPTAMILPTLFPSKPAGVQIAVRHFVERSGIPAVLYIKDEGYITPEAAAELVNDGLISWIKYAIVRQDTTKDAFLSKLVTLVNPEIIVSGIGEQPAIIHLRDFGVNGFTSGCVCVAPAHSMRVMHAIHAKDYDLAEKIREEFRPLEDQRNAHGPIPVLHHAVELAGVAKTGPFLPLLAPLPDGLLPGIGKAAKDLLSKN